MGEKKDSDDENDVVEEEGNQDNDESHKKKKKDNLAQGKHYYVFVVQCPTKKGPPVRFIVARYCVANHSHQWLWAKLEYIESSLAFYGFIVCSKSFGGASKNCSCMTYRTTLSFEDICGTVLKVTTPEAAAAATIDATTSTGVGMEDIRSSSSNSCSGSNSSSSSSSSNDSDMDEVSAGEDTEECTKRLYAENDLPWNMKFSF